ncbi:hypothetical protein KR018_008054 [Drosophila ironensis]|nr:hypothetical protein KR018_008054 [Drosophila ironensis]
MAGKYEKLQQQFLCCYPVKRMAWSAVKLPLSWADQGELLAATCCSELNKRYPVRRSYLEAFIKQLIHLLKDQTEVHDDLYGSLVGRMVETPAPVPAYAYKHYLLQPGAHITLRESNSFVSEGTTGLCTWEAALALGDYILQHKELVLGKNVVELGAGAGLLGILLKLPAMGLQTGRVLLTDGSESCVQLMRENIALNFGSKEEQAEKNAPQVELLNWVATSEFPWQNYADIDMLLAADVVYDESQFGALLGALDFLYKRRNNQLEMLLSSTVRNVDTLHKFMDELGECARGYKVTPCANVSACASHFCRDHTAAVQIISIRR